MSKEKQIEEMAKAIDGALMSELGVRLNDDILAKIAEHLYDANCRKQSEVTMKIFEEIDEILAVWAKFVPEAWHIHQEIAELKKKYIGEQENEQKI